MKKQVYIGIGIIVSISVVVLCILLFQHKRVEADYNPKDTVLLTIDGEDIYLDEVMYHVTLAKMQGQLYASFMNDSDYMNSEYGDGRTIGEVLKQQALDNAIRYELLYQQAIKEGYFLTEEELTDSQKRTESILVTIPEKEQQEMGLDTDKLLSIQKKIALASKYYADMYEQTNLTEDEAYDKMKEGRNIVINKKVWKEVPFS